MQAVGKFPSFERGHFIPFHIAFEIDKEQVHDTNKNS